MMLLYLTNKRVGPGCFVLKNVPQNLLKFKDPEIP